jgi:hypothetical protein
MKKENEIKSTKQVSKARKVARFFNPLSGLSNIFIKPTTSQLTEVKEVTKEIAHRLNPIGAYEKAKSNSRHESFNEAMNRLKVTEDDLKKTYNFSIFMSRLAASILIACLIWSLYFFTHDNFFNGISMVSLCFLNLAVQHKYSFRAYQVEKRKLGGHDEFMKYSKDWRNWVSEKRA